MVYKLYTHVDILLWSRIMAQIEQIPATTLSTHKNKVGVMVYKLYTIM